jgi:hypothetical protein
MKKVNGRSKFGYVWHFNDDERGDIYFSLAHQGESCASIARRYEVSPSVIRRVFRQMVDAGARATRLPVISSPQRGAGARASVPRTNVEGATNG